MLPAETGPQGSPDTVPVMNSTLKKKSLVLGDGKVYKIQKVRQRRILSCIPCHQRKIKCSRGDVCEHCRRNHLICQYFINDKLSNLKGKEERPPALDHLKSRQTTAETSPDPASVTPQDKVATVSDMSDTCEEVSMPTPTDVVEVQAEDPGDTRLQTEVPEQITIERLELLRYEDNISSSPEVHHDEVERSPISPQTQMTAATSNTTHSQMTVIESDPKQGKIVTTLEAVVGDLPSKERSDQLVAIYFNSIHPILPIIDLISFKEEYNSFWRSGLFLASNIRCLHQNSRTFESFGEFKSLFQFVWLYEAIIFAAAVADFEQRPCPTDDDQVQEEFNKYYYHYLALNEAATSDLSNLDTLYFQVKVLVLTFSDLTKSESLLKVAKLIRTAQFYKLDHDPVIHGNLNNKSLIQLKRLVWWQIFKLDDIVSGFHNLSSSIKLQEFDTSLPAENSDQLLPMINDLYNSASSNFSNYTICFLNSKFRYYLLQNELNGVSNGLNASMNDSDIINLKFKINDLYIFCYSSIISLQNTEKMIQFEAAQESVSAEQRGSWNQQLKFISYAKLFLNALADKILIKLQSRILATPDSVMNQLQHNNDKFYHDQCQSVSTKDQFYQRNSTQAKLRFMMLNLNLLVDGGVANYNYNDLSSNLLPSLLHLVDVFIRICEHREQTTGEDLADFNWELRNYVPFEEITLLTTILVVNLKSKALVSEEEVQLKVYMVDTSIRHLVTSWVDKSYGFNRTIRKLNAIWSMAKYKYGLSAVKRCYKIPEPSLSPSPTAHVAALNQQQARTTISCSEIAPRTMRAQVANATTHQMMGDSAQADAVLDGPEQLTDSELVEQLQRQMSPHGMCVDEFRFEIDGHQDQYYKRLEQDLNDLLRLIYA